MNIYFVGMLITMIAYIVIGGLISKGVKSANDFYVAGRNTPTYLITGSLVASFIGVGLFMGDVGECYSGFFGPIILAVGILSVGYIIGSVFFGRYLRRSNVVTIPEYFGKRFNSPRMQMLATVTSIFIMLVYSLSTVKGIGTLMNAVTGVDYNMCIIMVVIVFTLITIFSGAKGVLITDTIMYAIFSIATLIGAFYVAKAVGGWGSTVSEMATYQAIPDILSGHGNLSYYYPNARDNMIWATGYGFAWMAVLMVAPWQSSRYLMAKNEHTVIRSSIVASGSVILIEFLMCMAGVFTQKLNPGMENPSQALVWASMNIMPSILGIVVLSGVLASGISSATTFLSLMGSNVTNDVMKIEDGNKSLKIGRIMILVIGILIGVFTICMPASVFWITQIGATVIACAWLPACMASIWSKRVTEAGAFWGMLVGFCVSAVYKVVIVIRGLAVPIYFDPFFVGLAAGVIAMVIASALTTVTEEEKKQRAILFIMPESEKDPKEIKITRMMIALSIPMGIILTIVMIVLWAVPYNQGLGL